MDTNQATLATDILETQPTNQDLTISEAAAAKVTELLESNNKEEGFIRVFVKSGGCSGYTYGMSIDDKKLEGDKIFTDKNVRIVVDKMSLPLLAGSQIDYIESMMGGGFSVENPNATSACGCGHSFRTDGATAPDGESASCH